MIKPIALDQLAKPTKVSKVSQAWTVFAMFTMIVALSHTHAANAANIAYWNFNDGAAGNSAANTANLFSVDGGLRSGSATPADNASLSSDFDPLTITSFGGTVANNTNTNGSAAGVALALQGGVTATPTENNGKYLFINLGSQGTLGLQDLEVSFASQRTATGFNSDIISYTTDGVNYTDFATFTPNLVFGVSTFDFGGITSLNNNANAGFRIKLDGATAASGNNRFDNLAVTTTPEPETWAMMGLGVVALAALQFRRKRESEDQSFPTNMAL